MRWGAQREFLEDMARRDGAEPKALSNRVEVSPVLSFYYEAFIVLSSSRTVGMATNPIPLSEMLAYCDLYGLDGDERHDFVYLIQSLDREYLNWVMDQSKKKSRERR